MLEDEQQRSSYNNRSDERRSYTQNHRRRDLMDPFSDFFDDDPFFSSPFGGFGGFGGFGRMRRMMDEFGGRMRRMMDDFDFDNHDQSGGVYYSSTTTTTSVNGV